MTRLFRHILIASAVTVACAVSAWAQTSVQAADKALATDAETPLRSDKSPYPIAVLRALDKITARTTTIEAIVGQPVTFRTLTITARYCRKRPPEETPETFAYLQISDTPPTGAAKPVFSGWMLASGPALNPMEHSVYDVWVMGCKRKPSEPKNETSVPSPRK